MNASTKILKAAAGTSAAGGSVTVDQVFSTDLYTGNGGTKQITNNLDLSGEGGLTWIKFRNPSSDGITGENHLFDTVRGATKRLRSNSTAAEQAQSTSLTAFNSDGFTLGSFDQVNSGYNSRQTYCAWNFRVAPKFFDIQTWSGNSTTGRAIPHNLKTDVGMIIVKWYDGSQNWAVWHRSLTAGKFILLNGSGAAATYSALFTTTTPTSTHFYVGDDAATNGTSANYVAYIFADNSSEDAADRMISCGSFAGNESTYPTITLGFEPQWILVKSITNTRNWAIFDTMRGLPVGGGDEYLRPNTFGAETTNDNQHFNINATGFSPSSSETLVNGNGETYIYMAIRRDNQAEVTDATKVFGVNAYSGNGTANRLIPLGFAADLGIVQARVGAGDTNAVADRIRGSNNLLNTPNNHPELTSNTDSVTGFDNMNGIEIGSDTRVNWSSGTYAMYGWKRAKSYFDIVAYNGTGSVQNVPHSLGSGSPPEMMWVKARTNAYSWSTQHKAFGANQSIDFNSNASLSGGRWNNTRPTDVSFTLGTDFETNRSGYPYIAYLFATLAGVSKVSSVVHSGTTNVDAGFSNGSRFVLLKLIGSGSGWYIWNSVSGIASGNDPYLLLNSTAAEVTNTDYIDPYSAGFTLTSSFPAGTYIYYAIA